MFFPLGDNAPLQVIRFQVVTLLIILVNVVAFLSTDVALPQKVMLAIAAGYGVVPAEFLGFSPPIVGYDPISEPLTLITYQFLHASWGHILSNMLFLWVFADNVEDAFGHVAFLIFYLLCGVAGALTHIAIAPHSLNPLIGASGAVSGALGAYFLLFPRARVLIIFTFLLPLRLGAAWVLGGWFLLQVISVFMASGEVAVAFWAHIGGFLAGIALTLALRNRLLIRIGR
jgi:membrane associated rhomboid family serine protease